MAVLLAGLAGSYGVTLLDVGTDTGPVRALHWSTSTKW